jgi:hypothetical protein
MFSTINKEKTFFTIGQYKERPVVAVYAHTPDETFVLIFPLDTPVERKRSVKLSDALKNLKVSHLPLSDDQEQKLFSVLDNYDTPENCVFVDSVFAFHKLCRYSVLPRGI